MTLLSHTKSSVECINEVVHNSNSDTVGDSWTLQNIDHHINYKMQNKSQSKIKISLIMPSDLEVHRQVTLINANISKETKLALQRLLKKFNLIISKGNNDRGQMDLIKIHITMRLDLTPVAARLYPLTLQHHDFLEQNIKIY